MEQWRDIPGYETLYQASDRGRIRTCEGKVTGNARYARRVWKQRILKQKVCRNKKGRCDARVELWKDGKHKTYLVARLVAMAWVDGYTPELTVNHRDGNPLNNKADNLEWLPFADNIRHGFSTGLYPTMKPVKLQGGKEKVLTFDSMSAAGRFLGRSSAYISSCLKRNRPITSIYGEKYEVVRT